MGNSFIDVVLKMLEVLLRFRRFLFPYAECRSCLLVPYRACLLEASSFTLKPANGRRSVGQRCLEVWQLYTLLHKAGVVFRPGDVNAGASWAKLFQGQSVSRGFRTRSLKLA